MENLLIVFISICSLVGLYVVLRFIVRVFIGTVEQLDRLHQKIEKYF